MQIINLYRYIRSNGSITMSTIKPDIEYTELYRLVADEGMILTNGDQTAACVDVIDVSVWTEIIDNTHENNDINEDNLKLNAEIIEKAKAYDILMGVSE